METTPDDAVLEVEVDDQGSLCVSGDIDIAGGPILEAAIVASETSSPLVLVLADVAFIDSSGLRVLIAAAKRASQRSTTVVLREVGPNVSRLLQITGTTELFMIEPSNG